MPLPLQHRRRSLQQVVAAWREHCRRTQLLRQVLGRLAHRTTAAAFEGWRTVVRDSSHRRALLQVRVLLPCTVRLHA